MKPEDRTRLVMQALGWQGGTVHDLCREIGVDVHDFLYADAEDVGMSSPFSSGWFAIRTSPNSFKELAVKRKGDLQWFFGVAAGQNLINLGDVKMFTITVPTKILKAVALFAAKKDVRYYLNGVLFECKDGALRLVATNGHILAVAKLPCADVQDFSYIVPDELIAASCKTKAKELILTFTPDDKGATVSCSQGLGLSMRTLEGTFPDWRRVCADPVSPIECGTYNATYQALIAKAAVISESCKHGTYAFEQHGTSSAVWALPNVNIAGVLMPLCCPEGALNVLQSIRGY